MRSRIADFALFAMLFTVTFEKYRWNVGGKWNITELFALLFLFAYVRERVRNGDRRLPRTSIVIVAFFTAFLLVYLTGFYNLQTHQAAAQFAKGMGKFVLHFAFLAAAIDYLWRRSESFYWRAFGWFCAGCAVNAAYGILQLFAAQAGHNLDSIFVNPFTGSASQIEIYGAVNGTNVYRANGLTEDPNHLGIFLIIPLLVLAPVYLRLERGHRLRLPLALLIALFVLAELATLSRSGILGLVVGVIVLAVPYRRYVTSPRLLAPLAGAAVVVVAVVAQRQNFFSNVLHSRLEHNDQSTSAHFGVYGFIPHVIHTHPLFGLGFNNFSVYYEFVTGKTNWGPHSFYVALMVETGLVGTILFAVFLGYLFLRLGAARRLGKTLALIGDPLEARIRPLAWGLTAALVGTMAANVFYLTMTFFYFYVFILLAVAVPVVFGRRLGLGTPAHTA